MQNTHDRKLSEQAMNQQPIKNKRHKKPLGRESTHFFFGYLSIGGRESEAVLKTLEKGKCKGRGKGEEIVIQEVSKQRD